MGWLPFYIKILHLSHPLSLSLSLSQTHTPTHTHTLAHTSTHTPIHSSFCHSFVSVKKIIWMTERKKNFASHFPFSHLCRVNCAHKSVCEREKESLCEIKRMRVFEREKYLCAWVCVWEREKKCECIKMESWWTLKSHTRTYHSHSRSSYWQHFYHFQQNEKSNQIFVTPGI